MKPNHTKDQRKRLFLLARLLDRVNPRRFDMSEWFLGADWRETSKESAKRLKRNECGFAGCAMGWAMTDAKISLTHRHPLRLLAGLGFSSRQFATDNTDAGTALFGPDRSAGPRRVSADIRRYLKDGTLPKA